MSNRVPYVICRWLINVANPDGPLVYSHHGANYATYAEARNVACDSAAFEYTTIQKKRKKPSLHRRVVRILINEETLG